MYGTCLVVYGFCLVVSAACLVVSGVWRMPDGVRSMSGGGWLCLVHVWWCLVMSDACPKKIRFSMFQWNETIYSKNIWLSSHSEACNPLLFNHTTINRSDHSWKVLLIRVAGKAIRRGASNVEFKHQYLPPSFASHSSQIVGWTSGATDIYQGPLRLPQSKKYCVCLIRLTACTVISDTLVLL